MTPVKRKHSIVYYSATILLSLLVTACSKDDEKKPVKISKPKIVLSADGLGPINANTSFNMHQMSLAFSDYGVSEEMNFQEGSPYPVIRIADGVKTLFTINPDNSRENIFSIVIEDNLIENSLGHQIGANFVDIYSYGQTSQCVPGIEEMSGKVICKSPQTGNILYLFTGEWDGADGTLPPRDNMLDWVLEEIIWKPK